MGKKDNHVEKFVFFRDFDSEVAAKQAMKQIKNSLGKESKLEYNKATRLWRVSRPNIISENSEDGGK